MRIIFLFLLFGLNSTLIAQKLSDFKSDSIIEIDGTDLSLIYYKKKTAVWDNKFNYLILESTKNKFVFLKSTGFLVEVDFKKKDFYALVSDKTTLGYRHFLIGNTNFNAQIKYCGEENYNGEYVLIDTFQLNSSLEEIENISHTNNHLKIGDVKLEIIGHNLFITDFKKSYEDNRLEPKQIVLKDKKGNPILSQNGNKIFLSDAIVLAQSNSGIYNYKKNNWILLQKYHQLYRHHNYVLVSELNMPKYRISYTSKAKYLLFEVCDNQKQLIKDNVTFNDKMVVDYLVDFDSISQLPNKTHYLTYKNGQKGLMKFQFFENNEDDIFKIDVLNFEVEDILDPVFDFIYYGNNKGNIVALKNDSITLYSSYYKDTVSTVFNDTNSIVLMSKPTYLYAETAYHDFGANLINDSLLIIIDSEFEESIVSDYILESIEFPGEDSIDGNGNFVYERIDPLPGKYNSGVFNLNSNSWVISPDKYDIKYAKGNAFLITNPKLDEYGNIMFDENKNILDLYNLKGEIIANAIDENTIQNTPKLLNVLLCLPSQSISKTNSDLYSNLNIPQSQNSLVASYLIKDKKKYKHITYDFEFKKILSETNFHDFVRKENERLTYSFIIDSNVINLAFGNEVNNQKFNFKSSNYTIEISKGFESAMSLVEMTFCSVVSNNDTIFKSNNYNLKPSPKSTISSIRITCENNELMVQSDLLNVYSNRFLDEDFYTEITYNWMRENSELWRKKEGHWKRVTTNYATIEKFSKYYICETGAYDYIKSQNEDVIDEKHVSNTFVLLDSVTLKAKSFMDFYNFDKIVDLGFGLKITPISDDKKYYANSFFVDEHGKALCNANYDNFILINGELFGIKNKIYELDSKGNEILDEKGNPIVLQNYSKKFISNYSE